MNTLKHLYYFFFKPFLLLFHFQAKQTFHYSPYQRGLTHQGFPANYPDLIDYFITHNELDLATAAIKEAYNLTLSQYQQRVEARLI